MDFFTLSKKSFRKRDHLINFIFKIIQTNHDLMSVAFMISHESSELMLVPKLKFVEMLYICWHSLMLQPCQLHITRSF